MSYLFEIRGNSVLPDASLLTISPFKDIWARDKSKDKSIALKEFAYIEFMSSMMRSNPFSGYPETSRSDVIKAVLFKDTPKWREDDLIRDGIQFVKRVQYEGSATYSYYMAARASADNMKEFFMNVDLSERNDKNMPVYKPKDITSALIDTEKVIQNLEALQKKVEEEMFNTTRVKSGKTISPFANPESLIRHG